MDRREAPRPARSIRTGSLAAVALLCLAGQLGASSHFLLVSHRECSVHGLEEYAGHQQREGEATPARPLASVAAGTAASSLDDGHDQCLLALVRRSLASDSASSDLSPRAPGQPALVAQGLVDGRQGPALLRLAPKSSPPV